MPADDLTLAGKVALVTGAARGMGAAIAEALVLDGAAVVITDVLTERGEALAADLRGRGQAATFHQLDVCREDQWQSVLAATVATYGRLDVLVNNAGMTLPTPIEDARIEDARRLMDINYFGPFVGMQLALPLLKEDGGGAVINISSNSTRQIVAEAPVYSPSKAALANLSQVVAVDWARRGYNIRVNSIHPGPHATDMLLSGREHIPGLIDEVAASIPMGRLGRPLDIANAVVFLASARAAYITGTELFVDGGVTLA